MSTNFTVLKKGLFPRISQEYQGKQQQQRSTPHPIPYLTLLTDWYWNFLPSASSRPVLCHEGSMLAACSTCLSQPQFYTELFWDVSLYSYQRLGYGASLTLVPRYTRWPQIGASLRWCSALCRVKFRKVRSTVQYVCACTVHAVVKSRAGQQHIY